LEGFHLKGGASMGEQCPESNWWGEPLEKKEGPSGKGKNPAGGGCSVLGERHGGGVKPAGRL